MTLMCDAPDAADVVALAQHLITIDTSNYGSGECVGERGAAEWVMEKLEGAGYTPQYIESAPGRGNVVLRIPGRDTEQGALVLHGHLDVVPAEPSEWSRNPFSGEVVDGMLWGRGAVDMKGMDAMILAFCLDLARTGQQPERDLIIVFFADEEAGGVYGSIHLVENYPELFEGATEAVSEVGGYSVTVDGKRCYLVQTAEKGILWLRLVAAGRAGHGSQVGTDNAVTKLCQAVANIGAYDWPIELTPTVREFLARIEEVTGQPLDHTDFDHLMQRLGTTARWVGATLQNTSNPTMLEAGYKHNVIPRTAEARIDCRFLPGQRDNLIETLDRLSGPDVEVVVDYENVALETDMSGTTPASMVRALLAEDDEAHVMPYCLSGGTDNKALSELGIRGFGFAPLKLPPDLDFAGMFHGVDERVPADSLVFGRRVLERFLMGT